MLAPLTSRQLYKIQQCAEAKVRVKIPTVMNYYVSAENDEQNRDPTAANVYCCRSLCDQSLHQVDSAGLLLCFRLQRFFGREFVNRMCAFQFCWVFTASFHLTEFSAVLASLVRSIPHICLIFLRLPRGHHHKLLVTVHANPLPGHVQCVRNTGHILGACSTFVDQLEGRGQA